MERPSEYKFKGKLWRSPGKGGWHFLTVPKALSRKLRDAYGFDEEGWGRLKTEAQIGKSKWKTALWFATKSAAYLLPIKSEVKKKESLKLGLSLTVVLSFDETTSGLSILRQRKRSNEG